MTDSMTDSNTIEAPVEAIVQQLAGRKAAWVQQSKVQRLESLRRCLTTVAATAAEWATVACLAKGIDPTSPLAGEEWMIGPVAVLTYLQQLIRTLEAEGQLRPPKLYQRHGQWIAQVFPDNWLDRLFWVGLRGEVWLQPGQPPTQATCLKQVKPAGHLALVLGAGNVSAIAPLDALSKLFTENAVVLLKLNPVNDYMGGILEKALQPLCDQGYLAIVYGEAEVGRYLCQHPLVESVHVTGSYLTYKAIAQQLKDQPKPITAELGCVTPVLVVPGHWALPDLAYQARQVASMVVHNASFNCAAAKVLVTARDWPQRSQFLALVQQELAQTPLRTAYYPGARDRYQQFVERYPQAQRLAPFAAGADELEWLWIEDVPPRPGEYALTQEAFCGVLAHINLPAATATDFLQQAIPCVNEQVWGSLSCTLLIDPVTQRQQQEVIEQAVTQLRYGAIGINIWSGVIFGVPSLTWGAFPANSVNDIQSGCGTVHNGYLFDYPQKSVLRSPVRRPILPPWFARHPNLLALARHYTALQANPSFKNLLETIGASLRKA